MPKNSDDDRVKLQQRLARIQDRLRQLDAREQKQKRADDTRRKILYGAEAFNLAADDPAFAKLMQDRLERNLTRPIDRKLFGLPDLPGKEAQEVKAEGEAESA